MMMIKLTEECDPFEVLDGHLKDEPASRCDQHCHQNRGPSNLLVNRMRVAANISLGRLKEDSSHPKDIADMFIVVGEREEDREHEEVAADDDVRFITLWVGGGNHNGRKNGDDFPPTV